MNLTYGTFDVIESTEDGEVCKTFKGLKTKNFGIKPTTNQAGFQVFILYHLPVGKYVTGHYGFYDALDLASVLERIPGVCKGLFGFEESGDKEYLHKVSMILTSIWGQKQ